MPESRRDLGDRPVWPAHLQVGAVRFARTSRHYDDTVRFYREVVGLPVVGEFHASFGEDGIIFGFPDTAVQLEIVRAREGAVEGTFDQLVLYLDSPAAVSKATARLRAAGVVPIEQHPYWAAHGAAVYRDPDGRDVVFAPWVYGRDPEPAAHFDVVAASPVSVESYDGDRAALRHLFAEAEDSAVQLDAYLNDGRVLVARRGEDIVGHLQLVGIDEGVTEVKNMAVVPSSRGAGVGRALIETALAEAAAEGVARVVVATGAADVGNLRFYQRCGFRFSSIEQDAFTPATGYPEPIVIDGVLLRDRVWLEQAVPRAPAR
jgi:GNAT superfamily N-acetyltransferase